MKLNVQALCFSYGSKAVLRDVSFAVAQGEFLSVLGPNGAGKSTLFRCVLGILPDYTGRIQVDGHESKTLSQRQLAERIAYIPQIHRPTFGYTVLDTVLMGTTRWLSPFAQPKKEQAEQAIFALERLGIAELRDRNFSHLSGGEQQLTLIARALAQQADILIMDEPTSALDYGNQLRVLQRVRGLTGEGHTVLLSTHNPQHALSFSDRILALCGGSVAALGGTGESLTKDLIRRLYHVGVDFADTRGGRVIVPLMEGNGI